MLANPITYVVAGVVVLLLDLATGPLLQFPVLFVIPVTLGAWFARARVGYALAILLPLARFVVASYFDVDMIDRLEYRLANTIVRASVLVFVAYLAARAAKQKADLESRVDDLATMCAWSRTIEYEGDWISFEDYLERRFNQKVSHGISPAEADRLFASMQESSETTPHRDD